LVLVVLVALHLLLLVLVLLHLLLAFHLLVVVLVVGSPWLLVGMVALVVERGVTRQTTRAVALAQRTKVLLVVLVVELFGVAVVAVVVLALLVAKV